MVRVGRCDADVIEFQVDFMGSRQYEERCDENVRFFCSGVRSCCRGGVIRLCICIRPGSGGSETVYLSGGRLAGGIGSGSAGDEGVPVRETDQYERDDSAVRKNGFFVAAGGSFVSISARCACRSPSGGSKRGTFGQEDGGWVWEDDPGMEALRQYRVPVAVSANFLRDWVRKVHEDLGVSEQKAHSGMTLHDSGEISIGIEMILGDGSTRMMSCLCRWIDGKWQVFISAC